MTTSRVRAVARFSPALGLCLALGAGCLAAPVDDGTDFETEEVGLVDGVEEPARLSVTVEWGALAGYSTVSAAHDWSGTFVVTRGRLLPVAPIDFEGKDKFIATHRHMVVAFTSTTEDDSDGAALAIIDPAPSSGSFLLSYVWQGFTMWSVTVDPLVGVSAMLILDDGNRLSILGVPAD